MLKIERIKNDFIVTPYKVKRLNATISNIVEKQLIQLMDHPGVKLTLDLEGIEFIDSSGFDTLINLMKEARQAECTFYLCNISDDLQELINLLELDHVFSVNEDRPEVIEPA